VQNGGTAGTTNNYANYYQGTGGTFLLDPDAFIQTYTNVPSEYVGIEANVAAGNTGSASASFDTKTPQAYTYTTGTGSSSTTTSLSGALSVNVAKTSKDGFANAMASMQANSGVTADSTGHTGDGIVGTSARLYANETLTGVGSALAQVSQATATAYSTTPGGNYSKSLVAGDIKLTASNVDNDAIAQNGGKANGWADISAATYMTSLGRGDAKSIERMRLNATRGQSFSGTSYADGYLNGQETAESSWVNSTSTAKPSGNLNITVVDLETTSQITGSVVAHNIRDTSTIDAGLTPMVSTYQDGSASGSNDWFDKASVTRDTPIGINKTLKAEANAYMPIATWQGAASYVSPLNKNGQVLASVAGTQGLSWDGLPAKNQGFGVGAWIQSAYNQPQIATMEATQTASTVGSGTDKITYLMHLDGVKFTGTQVDAVGAFGGIANQAVVFKNNKPLSGTNQLGNINAINWLAGDDPNPIPGITQGKYYPAGIVITFPTPTALNRVVNLSY
jgi:hypothetical protein